MSIAEGADSVAAESVDGADQSPKAIRRRVERLGLKIKKSGNHYQIVDEKAAVSLPAVDLSGIAWLIERFETPGKPPLYIAEGGYRLGTYDYSTRTFTKSEAGDETASLPVRPLRVLAPLIKEDLANGNEAAKQAGMPYYRAAGEKLIKVAATAWRVRELDQAESRNLTAHRPRLHGACHSQNGSALPKWESLREFKRETSKPVSDDATAAKAQRRAEFAEDATRRADRHKAMNALAQRLINVGYRELAKELHPDIGGADDQMILLNEARNWLRQFLGAKS